MRKTLFLITFLSSVCMSFGAEWSEKQIEKLTNEMSLEEKLHLIVGTETALGENNHKVAGAAGFTYAIDRLGIPSINLADGPVGVRIHPCPSTKKYTSYCTSFPSSTALAATWNTALAYSEGEAIGSEAQAYGVDVVLTPGINIMRNPLCGRNFEYMSEDPLLGGIMAANMINGIQSRGVGTSLKHFVANNQQINKLYNDSRIPLRALREIYLKGFELCLRNSDPWTIMASYNKIGGVWAQNNYELLTVLLRDEWHYDGLVVSDWYKTRGTVGQLNAGLQLLMPGEQQQYDELLAAVNGGEIKMATIDSAVKSILGLISKTISLKGWKFTTPPNLEQHTQLSRQVAGESMVLLKNDNAVLPLNRKVKVALFGASAYHSIAGGGGSSNVNKKKIIDIYAGLENAEITLSQQLKETYLKYVDIQTRLLQKNPAATEWERLSYNRVVVPEMSLKKCDAFIKTQAAESDLAVIVIGRSSTEEANRRLENDYNLTDDERTMIENVSKEYRALGKKVVVVLNVCGEIETASWRDCADAVVLAWFPGMECGHAVADVLTGVVNPSGKLPMTFAMDYQDIPSSANYPQLDREKSGRNFDYTDYEEGIWVGYRYFATSGVKVAYPFGFGLSYTDFEYSNPQIMKKGDEYVAKVEVRNTGSVAGKEAVQLYVAAPASQMSKPVRELKAFGKTRLLAPGESEMVEMRFNVKDLASFDESISSWVLDKGTYEAQFAASSANIKTSKSFNIKKSATWKVNNILAPVQTVKDFKFTIKENK